LKNDDKKKQIRKTHLDTKNAQNKLRKMIKDKIEKNEGLSDTEKDNWYYLIADSFLSRGVDVKIYYNKPGIRLCFGTLHTFALRFLDWGDPVVFVYEGDKYMFSIKEMWKLFYEHCLEAFPYALGEAIHMSKEAEEREEWSGYDFSAKKELG